jgi:hypothetical protein
MLIVKAGRFKRHLLSMGFYGRDTIKIFRDEIMSLKKGDTAEITGTWGPHGIYKDVQFPQFRYPIPLTDREINILFKSI